MASIFGQVLSDVMNPLSAITSAFSPPVSSAMSLPTSTPTVQTAPSASSSGGPAQPSAWQQVKTWWGSPLNPTAATGSVGATKKGTVIIIAVVALLAVIGVLAGLYFWKKHQEEEEAPRGYT